mmetsp:Transcript_25030/g.28522  ORF Transcript_25030/g.28522 Transcript_25030/m.28522 type:complete len:217 (+) Transcript_25030:419-1069(+)
MVVSYPPGPVPAQSWSISSRTRIELDISLASENFSTNAEALASVPLPPPSANRSNAVTNRTKSAELSEDACAAAQAARAVTPDPPFIPPPTRSIECNLGAFIGIGAMNRFKSLIILSIEDEQALIPIGKRIFNTSSCLPRAGRTSCSACSKSATTIFPAPSSKSAPSFSLSITVTDLAKAKLAALLINPASSAPEKCSVLAENPSSLKSSNKSIAN